MRKLPGYIALTLLIGVLSACGRGSTPSVSAGLEGREGEAAQACALLVVTDGLVKSHSDTEIDRSIVRYQREVQAGKHPVTSLERLGWALVAKARTSHDAGYYNLVQQVTACIDLHAPDAAEGLLLQGHALHNLHQFRAAEAVARTLVRQRGLWLDHALLGDVLTERGSLEQAAAAYQVMADQRPGPQAYLRISHLRWLRGDLDGAIEIMARAVRAISPRTPEPAAWAHTRLAQLVLQAGDLEGSDALLTRALELQPGHPMALQLRARQRLLQGRVLDAIPLLEQAIRTEPLPSYRWALLEALQQAGRPDAAAVQRAVLLNQGEYDDRRTLAQFLASTGADPERAVLLARQELEQREDVFTLDAMAWALAANHHTEQALAYSRRALAEGTRDARLFMHAGIIASRSGARREAIRLLREARDMQQLLLPSERRLLTREFAALVPQTTALAVPLSPRPGHPVF